MAVLIAAAVMIQVGTGGASDARVTASCGTSQPDFRVGQVTDLIHGTVTANGEFVGSDGFVLRQGHYLCTDDTGQVIFRLTHHNKTTTCNTKPLSRVQLYPKGTPNRIIQFLPRAGTSWCWSRGTKKWFGTAVGPTHLYTDDPTIFGVTVTREKAVVEQTYGFSFVSTLKTKKWILLGPFEQVSIDDDGAVSEPTPFSSLIEDRAAIAELEAPVPRPSYEQPREISRKLKVGFKRGTPLDMTKFTKRYFASLAYRWRLVDLDFEDEDRRSSLKRGVVDIIVSRTRDSDDDIETLPFAQVKERTREEDWNLELLRDDGDLAAGLQRYLRASLVAADYAKHYRAAFGEAPSYERFREIIFPNPPAQPR